jgi:hypothetical protein
LTLTGVLRPFRPTVWMCISLLNLPCCDETEEK